MKVALFSLLLVVCAFSLSCKSDKSESGNRFVLKPGTLSNTLCGTFILSASSDSSSGIYDAFIFSGNGQGKVSASGIFGNFDFLQVFDTLYLFPDQDIFVFKVGQQGELIGLSNWVSQASYGKMENDTVVCSAPSTDSVYLYNYYDFLKSTVKDNKLVKINDPDVASDMERLCSNNFSKACLAMANIGMKKAFANSLVSDKKQKADDKVLGYIQKAIDQGDVKGYAKMGEYYMLLYDEDHAKEFYKKACDLGDLNSCMKMMENGWF